MTTTELATRATNGVVHKTTSYSVMPMAARVAYAGQISTAADLVPRGLFDKATGRPSQGKIFLVFEIGSMLGLEPMAAMQGIDVIEGKAAISPRLMSGIIRAAGHKLKITETGSVEDGDYRVDVVLTRSDDPENPIDSYWDMKRAQRAGLGKIVLNTETNEHYFEARSDRNNPLPWEMYTEDMCLWRAIGRLGRKGADDILNGIAYMPEELTRLVGEDGTRDSVVDSLEESELIVRIRAIDDKKDMAAIYSEIKDGYGWTPKLTAEFDSRFAEITIDTREQKPAGAPGSTGLAAIDGKPAESPAVAAAARGAANAEARQEQPAPSDEDAPPAEEPEPHREVSIEASDNAERAERKPVPVVVPEETEQERDDRLERENYEQYLAEQEADAARQSTEPKSAVALDMSALEPKPEQ